MQTLIKYFALIALVLPFSLVTSEAQVNEKKILYGSGGGMVGKDSQGRMLRATYGQSIAGKVAGRAGSGQNQNMYLGFWSPLDASALDIETPIFVENKFSMTNYPNPCTFSTTIKYELPGYAQVTLRIYDINGNLIKTLIDGYQDAGMQEIMWDIKNENGMDISSGTYLYELSAKPAGGFSGSFDSYNLRSVMVVAK